MTADELMRVGPQRKLSTEELMLLNWGAGEASWEFLGLQGDQTSQSSRISTLNINWKDWCWGWSFNSLATWCEELTHWKRPWCWERLKARGEGMTEDEMIGWHHWLDGHDCEQTLEDTGGQGSLVCCSPWGHKETDTTEQLNNNSELIDEWKSVCIAFSVFTPQSFPTSSLVKGIETTVESWRMARHSLGGRVWGGRFWEREADGLGCSLFSEGDVLRFCALNAGVRITSSLVTQGLMHPQLCCNKLPT